MDYFVSGLLVVLIIVVIMLIALLVRRWSVWGPKNLTYYQKCARDSFKEVTGDQWQTKNQETIDYSASVPEEKRNAFDHFMTGATYMYGRRYPRRIANNYRRALDEIQRGNVFEDEREFILERIRDHVQFHPEPFAEEELIELQEPLGIIFEQIRRGDIETPRAESKDIQQATYENFRDIRRREERNYNIENEHKRTVKIAKSTTKAERIENLKPAIRSDAENVHSSAITHEFSKQYKRLQIYNNRDVRGLPPVILDDEREADKAEIKASLKSIDKKAEIEHNKKAYNEALVWMGANFGKRDPTRWDELKRRFVNDFSLIDVTEGSRTTIPERDVIAAVWRRIHSPANASRKETLLEMLDSQIGECFQNGKSVCTTGRTENIHAALASSDADPKMGILKTDEVLKQEIYLMGSKIVADEIAKLPTDEQASYNNNSTAQLSAEKIGNIQNTVQKAQARIETEITAKYGTKLTGSSLGILIADLKRECSI